MKFKGAVLSILALCTVWTAFAEDASPVLPMSKAAKLAEDAIVSAGLPADCFLRSISLLEGENGPYYRATYKPRSNQRVRVVEAGTEPPPMSVDILRITMDGKVSFEQEQVSVRRKIIAK